MKSQFCILVLLRVLQAIGAKLSQYEQERQEVDEYVREATRLFNELPGWGEVLEMDELYGNYYANSDEEPVDASLAVEYEDGDLISSGEVPTTQFKTPLNTHLFDLQKHPKSGRKNPFTIEEEGLFESSKPDGCLRDRENISIIFKECIYKQMEASSPEENVTVFEESTPDYDKQFLKYCRKAPQLRECIKTSIIANMEDCLDEGMHETINNVEEVTVGMIRFICNKEADRIAIFIADGGFECLQSNSGRILGCLSANIASHVFNSLFDLPSLKLTIGKCLHLDLAVKCVNQELVLCKNRALFNIVGMVFNIAKEVASCRNTTAVDHTMHLAALPPVEDEDPKSAQVEFIPDHVENNSMDDSPTGVSSDDILPTTEPKLPANHVGKNSMDGSPTGVSSDYVLPTTEPKLPVTPHAHTISSDLTNPTTSSCYSEVTTVLLICALIFVSVIALLALGKLISMQFQRELTVK